MEKAKKPHPAGPENTAIPQFEIKIPEIPQEKWSDTAIPQTPMSPSCIRNVKFIKCMFLKCLSRLFGLARIKSES